MHRLERINLYNYKNFLELSIAPTNKVTLVLGKNGAGKTNFLEAIYQVCVLKNFRALPEQLLINEQATAYTLFAKFINAQNEGFSIGINANAEGKKSVLLNQKPLKKLASYIGKCPVMFFSPDDGYHILDTSENRRKLIDGVLSQAIPSYLEQLQRYNKYLIQRNAYLKSVAEQGKYAIIDWALLNDYVLLMEPSQAFICQQRKENTLFLNQRIQEIYAWLSAGKEKVHFEYTPSLVEGSNFVQELTLLQEKEIHSGRTALGNHKDDWQLTIENKALKKAGSQGQIKTFMIALKMACVELLEKHTQTKPIILLDDIFDKLDDDRISKLLLYIQSDAVGQVFLTDARPERSQQLLNAIGNTQAAAFEIIDNQLLAKT